MVPEMIPELIVPNLEGCEVCVWTKCLDFFDVFRVFLVETLCVLPYSRCGPI